MAELEPTRNEPPRWSKHSKTGALWVIMLLLSWGAWVTMRTQGERPATFTYTEFRQQLQADNVDKVTVIDQRRVEESCAPRSPATTRIWLPSRPPSRASCLPSLRSGCSHRAS